MIRILLTIVLPLLLPTLLYLLWLTASRRAALAAPAPWRDMPWVWLAAAGVVLAALLLFFVHIGVGSRGTYVPPKYIDGRVVPGHIVPGEPGR
ncbi:MAG TPA: DUF6111 family protein [Stellaceae bacterium]|nr:DUF6111 family protein [Stellaceae bacterium]